HALRLAFGPFVLGPVTGVAVRLAVSAPVDDDPALPELLPVAFEKAKVEVEAVVAVANLPDGQWPGPFEDLLDHFLGRGRRRQLLDAPGLPGQEPGRGGVQGPRADARAWSVSEPAVDWKLGR